MGFPDWQAFSSGFSEIGNRRRPKRELTGVQTVVEMEMGLFYYELGVQDKRDSSWNGMGIYGSKCRLLLIN